MIFLWDSYSKIDNFKYNRIFSGKDQSKLFNTFFRASNTSGFPGTGLGLYIVKTFTEKNSGTIKLDSKLGKGTKVTLQFPLQNG